jgi:hypothetical protein
MQRWQSLAEEAHPVARRSGPQMVVRYRPGPGVREELEALAEAERRCCSFVTWEVAEDGGHPLLRVSAKPESPDDVAPIAAVFGAN